jgi:GNAT superfamily N-acetyltransferase
MLSVDIGGLGESACGSNGASGRKQDRAALTASPAPAQTFAMAVIVRLATPSDLHAMQPLDPGRATRMRGWIEDRQAYIAIDGGEAVGYAMMTQHFFDRAFIDLLIVAERARRRGIATAILRHLEAESPTAILWTSTNESNAPMRALLAAEGYIPSGMVEGLDEGDPELFFRKRVRPD